MDLVQCLFLGAFIGWVGSLLMRTSTPEGILIDIFAGAIGALGAAMLLAGSSKFDALIAGYLGATGALAILYVLRRQAL